jgi:hypothetical protein
MFDRFDICSAYWLFGSLYHSGQFSQEYAYMGRAEKLGFRPGHLFQENSLTDNARSIYDNLVDRHMQTFVPMKQGKGCLLVVK